MLVGVSMVTGVGRDPVSPVGEPAKAGLHRYRPSPLVSRAALRRTHRNRKLRVRSFGAF